MFLLFINDVVNGIHAHLLRIFSDYIICYHFVIVAMYVIQCINVLGDEAPIYNVCNNCICMYLFKKQICLNQSMCMGSDIFATYILLNKSLARI